MSTMLEQAVIDADALREVALKNAETIVIEKYANQIKEAVENLLSEADLEEEMPVAEPLEEEAEEVVENLPPAHSIETGDTLCPGEAEVPGSAQCEQDVVTIDFGALAEEMEKLLGGESHGELAEDLAEELDEDAQVQEESEEVELNEELLGQLVEELAVDVQPAKSGWAGTPSAILELAEDELLAIEQDAQVKEEKAALRDAIAQLEESNQMLNSGLTETKERNKDLFETLEMMKDKLNESNILNAKLLYTNKVLTNDSLNERQKNEIVEALSKSGNVEEAKIIYETLQSAVSSPKKSKRLESLSEVVNKTSSTMLLSAKKEQRNHNPVSDRWKILAGIDNKD